MQKPLQARITSICDCAAAKTARLKQAKEEAEREVGRYRAQREEEFRKKLSDVGHVALMQVTSYVEILIDSVVI